MEINNPIKKTEKREFTNHGELRIQYDHCRGNLEGSQPRLELKTESYRGQEKETETEGETEGEGERERESETEGEREMEE